MAEPDVLADGVAGLTLDATAKPAAGFATAEDVAAWFAPWCSDKVQNQVGELDYYSDY